MTMCERVKRMTPEEMQHFVYWVYMCGNKDGSMGLGDSPPGGLISYFGGAMLNMDSTEVMPNDNIDDLWDRFEETYGKF